MGPVLLEPWIGQKWPPVFHFICSLPSCLCPFLSPIHSFYIPLSSWQPFPSFPSPSQFCMPWDLISTLSKVSFSLHFCFLQDEIGLSISRTLRHVLEHLIRDVHRGMIHSFIEERRSGYLDHSSEKLQNLGHFKLTWKSCRQCHWQLFQSNLSFNQLFWPHHGKLPSENSGFIPELQAWGLLCVPDTGDRRVHHSSLPHNFWDARIDHSSSCCEWPINETNIPYWGDSSHNFD